MWTISADNIKRRSPVTHRILCSCKRGSFYVVESIDCCKKCGSRVLLSDNKSLSDCSRMVGATLERTVPFNWDYAGITCCKMRTTQGYIRYGDTCHGGNGWDDCFHRWKQLFIVHRPAALLFDPLLTSMLNKLGVSSVFIYTRTAAAWRGTRSCSSPASMWDKDLLTVILPTCIA